MSKLTNNLRLYEVVASTDGNDKFNFTRMLNDNWETIDRVVGGLRLDVNLMPDADDIGEMIADGLTGVLKVKTGSYTGDGSASTFVFFELEQTPLVVFIREAVSAGGRGASVTIPVYGLTTASRGNAISYMYQTSVGASASDNNGVLVPLYCRSGEGSEGTYLQMWTEITGTQASSYQFNRSGTTYYWTALYVEEG